MHAAATTADGRWLAQLLCADGLDDMRVGDRHSPQHDPAARRGRSICARLQSAEDSVYAAIGYGDLVRVDPVLPSIEEVEPWRGHTAATSLGQRLATDVGMARRPDRGRSRRCRRTHRTV